jgi:hypothetical protein
MASGLFAQSYNATFRSGDDSWVAGYTGAPPRADDDDVVKIEWKETEPQKNNFAISFSGKNKSKNLFLYIYRQFTGLKPNSLYGIIFNTQFLVNNENQDGIIYVKAGALDHTPITFDLRLTEANFQKGKIGYDGKNLEVLGILYPTGSGNLNFQQMQNYAKPFYANTDKDGNIWLIIGIEPEVSVKKISPVYLSTLRILLQYQGAYSRELVNKGNEYLDDSKTDSEFDDNISSIEIYTGSGHLLKSIYFIDGILSGNITVSEFQEGSYFFVFNLDNGKKIIRNVEN